MSTVYRLNVPSDIEGRSMCTVGYFANHSDAVAIAKTGYKNSLHGYSPTDTYGITEINVHENIGAFLAVNPTAPLPIGADAGLIAKQRALAKLSPEDRKALGL
jgi:hypothetical protein